MYCIKRGVLRNHESNESELEKLQACLKKVSGWRNSREIQSEQMKIDAVLWESAVIV